MSRATDRCPCGCEEPGLGWCSVTGIAYRTAEKLDTRPPPTGYYERGVYHPAAKPGARKPIEREVVDPEPDAVPSPPWFTVHVDVSVAAILAVVVGVPCVVALLTVGSPDLLDAVVAWVLR